MQDLPFVQQLEPRMQAARAKLGAMLASGLQASLRAKQTSAMLHCLHAYASAGDTLGAEAVVRSTLAAPAVARVLSEHRKDNPRAGTSGDSLAKVGF